MRIRPIVVVVLVVLSGCSGIFGGGGSDELVETIAPAPVPTDEPTPTPVPQLAPGLTGEGIENASALVAAHGSFLQNRSFTIRSNTTRLAPNGSVISKSTFISRAGPPGEGFHITPERNGSTEHRHSESSPVHFELWSNGERVFVKRTHTNGTTTYGRVRRDAEVFRDSLADGSLYLLGLFGAANTTVTEQFTRNGTTLYRVRGTTRTDQRINVSLRLLVDSRGVIHEVRTVHRRTFYDNVTIISEMRFSKIGATEAPKRPTWVDEALSQTTPIPENPRRRDDETATSTDTNETATKTTSG